MKLFSRLWLAVLLAVSLYGPALLQAQEFRATVTGTITDPAGAAIPAATVTVRNRDTNEELTATTTDSGTYTLPFIRPGQYDVTATAAGFKNALRENIELRVSATVTVDFALQVGEAADTITVTDAAPLLDQQTATLGGVIDNQRIVELPLNGRNPFNLANLTTGVVFAGNLQFTRPFDNGDNVNFSINGGLRQTNSYLIDGAPDDVVTNSDGNRTRSQLNIAYIPTVDATQEFNILRNFYDAQYGRTGGGIINVTTKSGTNDLHGSAYYFLRRYQLEANNITNNANNFPRYARDPLTGENLGGRKLDQRGGVITGPLVIPKLYNGKDKTFFMFGFEDYRERLPAPAQTSVPSLLERQGNFSQSGVTIYDPFSTRLNPDFNSALPDSATNPQYIRTAFPGNIIPANRFNPVGQALLNAYPAPNRGSSADRLNNYVASPNFSDDTFRNWIGRVDQNFSDKQRMFFRYAYNRRNQIENGASGYTGIGRDAQDPLIRENHNAVVDSVTVLNSTTILNLRASLTRYREAADRQQVFGFDATSVGFPASFSNSRYSPIPPRITLEQYPDFGTRGVRQDLTNIISLQPSVSIVRGTHSLKTGMEFRDIRANMFGGSFVFGGGQFSFNRAFTQRLPQYAETTSGNAVASLLLGVPVSGTIQEAPAPAYRWAYTALYFQDDWKVTRRLSVNLGLRYDVEGSPTERYDRQNRGFALGTASPLAAAARTANPNDCPACANLTGGLLFAGANGQSRSAFENDWNNWQPRIGAAYQVAPLTVLRGGFGIFYLPQANFGGAFGFNAETPFASTIGGGVNQFTPATTLSNPFPTGLNPVLGSSQGQATFQGLGVQFSNVNRRIPKVHMYSFGVQHQLPGNSRLDVSYVGSRSIGINTGDYQAGNVRNLNVNSVEQLARARQDSRYFTEAVPNPFAGLLPRNPSLNGATVPRQQLLLPYPQFTSINIALEPVGRLWYDSLQVNFEKRYSDGLVFVAAYTWSKNLERISYLNNQDAEPTKVLTSADRPHRLVLSGVYQLPFGRGRQFGSDIGRFWNLLVGGWEYNLIGTIQSGTPLEYQGAVDLIGNPAIDGQSYDNYFNPCVLQLNGTSRQRNAARNGFESCSNPVWAIRGPNTLRTIPFRSGSIRNPWQPQFDMSLNKRFIFTERVNAQFRFETFNTFNTPILGAPVNDPNSQQFGFVNRNQSNYPRQVQLGFKLNF